MNIGTLTASLGVNTDGLNQAQQEFKRFENQAQTTMSTVNKAVDTSTQTVKKYSQVLSETGNVMGDFSTQSVSQMKDSVNKQKQAIQELQQKLKELQDQAKNATGTKKSSLLDQAGSMKSDIIGEQGTQLKMMQELKLAEEAEVGTQGNLVGSLGKWAIGLMSVTAAMELGKKIIESTEITAHAWEQTITEAQSAVGFLFQTLATGDWSGFQNGLETAIQGARDYVDAMELVQNKTNENLVLTAKFDDQIAVAYEKTYNRSKDNRDTRLEGLQEVVKLTEEKFKKLVDVAELKRIAILDKISTDTGGKVSTAEIDKFITSFSSVEELYKKGEDFNKLKSDFEGLKKAAQFGAKGLEVETNRIEKAWRDLGEVGKVEGQKALDIGKIIMSRRGEYAKAAADVIELGARGKGGAKFVKRQIGTIETQQETEKNAPGVKQQKDITDAMAKYQKAMSEASGMTQLFGNRQKELGLGTNTVKTRLDATNAAFKEMVSLVGISDPRVQKLAGSLEMLAAAANFSEGIKTKNIQVTLSIEDQARAVTKLKEANSLKTSQFIVAASIEGKRMEELHQITMDYNVALENNRVSKILLGREFNKAAADINADIARQTAILNATDKQSKAYQEQIVILEKLYQGKKKAEGNIIGDKLNKGIQQAGQIATDFLGQYSTMVGNQAQRQLDMVDSTAKAEGKSAAWVAKEKDKINKEANKKQQNAAKAQAIINGALAITNILATTPKYDFGVMTAIMIGAAVATTAAQVAIIGSQKMAAGGVIPPGYSNDTYPALLSSGETVTPPGKLPSAGAGNQTIRIEGKMVADGKELVYLFDKEYKLMKSY